MALRKPLIANAGVLSELSAADTVEAGALKSATTSVSVSAATAPSVGQVLTATDGATATWKTPTVAPPNASIAAQSGFAADTYLAGSSIQVLAGSWKVKTIYKLKFDMAKTAAGVAAFTLILRMGTSGSSTDAAILTLSFAAGTALADTGLFEFDILFRAVGASAVVQGVVICGHHLAATGLITTGASGTGIILGTSAAFSSTLATFIGVSINGGSLFAGTCTTVSAELINI